MPPPQTSFIPLLTLGIPPNAVMALMVGAMTIHGIVPGPQVMQKQPELVWGMIASMWVASTTGEAPRKTGFPREGPSYCIFSLGIKDKSEANLSLNLPTGLYDDDPCLGA